MPSFSLQPMAQIKARALDAQAFAEFGQVVEHEGKDRRRHFPVLLQAGADTATWVSRINEALSSPARIALLERHPHSSQLFVPLRGQPSLIVVCRSTASGAPDFETVQAFIASPWQGVSYRRNVWHHGLSVLRAPAEFFVSMAVGSGDDDVFLELDRPLSVTWTDAEADIMEGSFDDRR